MSKSRTPRKANRLVHITDDRDRMMSCREASTIKQALLEWHKGQPAMQKVKPIVVGNTMTVGDRIYKGKYAT